MKQYRYGTRQVNTRTIDRWEGEVLKVTWPLRDEFCRSRREEDKNATWTTDEQLAGSGNVYGMKPGARESCVWSTRRRHPICRRCGDYPASKRAGVTSSHAMLGRWLPSNYCCCSCHWRLVDNSLMTSRQLGYAFILLTLQRRTRSPSRVDVRFVLKFFSGSETS